jgi:DNA-binding transcriptional LysR family regulator
MDRFTSIAAFVRVAEHGGFSAAARHSNLSTATISGQVQALEDSLGVRLLNRTTRKVSLTDVGREYYERCAQILHELDEADGLANALQQTPRGKLRLHCNPAIIRFIAPVIAAYLRDNPAVSVDLHSGYQMIDLLEEGFDLAIRANMPPDSSFVARRLADWRHVLCCAPSYLKSHDAPRTPADLANHNCIRFCLLSARRRVALFRSGRSAGRGARRRQSRHDKHRHAACRRARRRRVAADGPVHGSQGA